MLASPDMKIMKETLQKGTANRGVYICSVEEKGNICFRFFQKNIDICSREYELSRVVFFNNMATPPFVKILGLSPQVPDGASGIANVYMEYLPGAGEFKLSDISSAQFESHADYLASKICRSLAVLDGFIRRSANEMPTVCSPVPNSLDHYLSSADSDAQLFYDLSSVSEAFDRLRETFPYIYSHNDLHYHNLWIPREVSAHPFQTAPEYDIRILDYGLCGANLAGAELHHFYAIQTMSASTNAIFFGMLVKRYSECLGIPEDIVRIGACYYAILRMARRLRLRDSSFRIDNERLSFMIEDFREMISGVYG